MLKSVRIFAGVKRVDIFTYAIFEALKKIVDGSSSRFESGKLFVMWIFVDGFLKLNFGVCCFFDQTVHDFELQLERLHAGLDSCKKVFCLQLCEALYWIIANCEICPKCRSQGLQTRFMQKEEREISLKDSSYTQVVIFKDHLEVVGQPGCTHEPETKAISVPVINGGNERGI
jgi:hypothetical protein